MRIRLTVAAILAVFAACALSLGLAAVAMAGGGNHGQGNHGQGNGGATQVQAAPGGGSHSTATSGPGSSTQGCDGSHNSNTGHGANRSGPYNNTCNGAPSGNGNGNGKATGKPCAGCVGNADDKNPKGQYPNGSDHNAGYECDRNHGIGRTNPAHTGCGTQTSPPPSGCTKPNGCDHGGGGGCTKPHGCHHGGGNGCTKPEGCEHGGGGNGCTKPEGCEHGGGGGKGGESCPGGTMPGAGGCGTTSTPTTTTNTTTGPEQAVLGTRTQGRSNGSGSSAPKTPQSEVLGVSESGGGTPASASNGTAPAQAVQARPATAGSQGSLPFTGSDLVAVILAGLVVLLIGLGLRRLLVRV
jgi:hypothetical protein